MPLQGASVMCYGGEREGFGEVDMGPLLGAIAGCHCRSPMSALYLSPIFRVTNFKQTPKKITMNFV